MNALPLPSWSFSSYVSDCGPSHHKRGLGRSPLSLVSIGATPSAPLPSTPC